MTAAEYSDRFDMMRVATRTFQIIGRNALVFGALALLLYGLPHLGADIIEETTDHLPGYMQGLFWGSGLIYALISLAGLAALHGAIVHGSVADLNGYRATLMECLTTGLRVFLPVAGVVVLLTIGVVLGLIALIVPGLVLLTTWLVAIPAAVVEKTGVTNAFARSVALTRGYRWQIFGLVAIFCIVAGVVSGIFESAEDVAHHALNIGILPFEPISVMDDLIETIVALVASVGAFVVYYELRSVKEDAGPGELTTALD